MCGICGAIDFSGASNAAEVVRLMTPTMLHRGPDDEGIFTIAEFGLRNADSGSNHFSHEHGEGQVSGEGSLALGMRRLSIIDIEGGHQPIFNDKRTVGVILNGEIYNFQELQQQLIDRGHKFHTRSDSEVVVHAYEEWGAECVERFQGMFALAIYDGRKEFRVSSFKFRVNDNHRGTENTEEAQRTEPETRNSKPETPFGTLFLARDRMGIKPLYYYAKQFRVSSFEFRDKAKLETRNSQLETFLFASEVRTLLASGLVPRKLSRDAVESYLLFGSVSEPLTLIEDVVSLPPGHRMTITDGRIEVERYWAMSEPPAVAGGHTAGKMPALPTSNGGPSSNGSGSTTGPPATAGGTDKNGEGPPATAGGTDKNGEGPPATAGGTDKNGEGPPATAGGTDKNGGPAKHVRALLEDSVRKHLIADVPVGVFLSSGIDSTALAALASREVSGVHTFTVAFPEGEFSEAAIARRTAATLGTTHREVMLSGDDMLARLGEAVGALDQPTMDGINSYFVSASARAAGLKVALSGLGGDEVFGGYTSFRRTPQYERMARAGGHMPAGVRRAMAAAMSSAGGRFLSGDAARKMSALWRDSDLLPDPYYFNRLVFTPQQLTNLMRGEVATTSPWRDWLQVSSQRARQLDSFAAVSCLEAESYLVNTLLRDTDSMSMAHSLEVRVPFLDHPLVEYVTHLPQRVKLSDGTPKALLRAAMADLLPGEVVNQPKRGFTFPWAEWLRGPLKQSVEQGLSNLSPTLSEIVHGEAAYGVWQSYLDGQTSWSRPWTLFVLNEWVKRHL
jgi:asparagine synthetase B (glutamine-hydrolysing)